MRVKICGITTRGDALAAIECGADALGFNLWPRSRRYIERTELEAISANLPVAIERVAVLVDPSFPEAMEVAQSGFVDSLQLHGHESTEFCAKLRDAGIRYSKAIAVQTTTVCDDARRYETDAFVLDTASAAGFGGTGQTFPWELAGQFIAAMRGSKVWLAGGLTPENVGDAIRVVQPYGVDVTTGVESVVRCKDRARVKAFIDAAHAA